MSAPIVSDVDRAWAIAQRPLWCKPGFGPDEAPAEIVDDDAQLDTSDVEGNQQFAAPDARGRFEAPYWAAFVDEQITAFERYFAAERKSTDEWSRLFRSSWWPKADPAKRYPKSKPRAGASLPPSNVNRNAAREAA